MLLGVAGIASLFTGSARADVAPAFTLAPDSLIVGSFAGFGGQLNQHVYADISGPPPNVDRLDAKVLAMHPQFVRVFFNTSEWTSPIAWRRSSGPCSSRSAPEPRSTSRGKEARLPLR